MATWRDRNTGEIIEVSENGQVRKVKPPTMAERVESKIQNQARPPVEYEFSRTKENFIPSAKQAASDVYQAVTNPIDTLTGIGRMAGGAVQKFHPDAISQDMVPYADAAGQFYADRYGGMDELKTTAMEDPVGMLGDIAGLATGIGAVPKLGVLGKIGSVIDPMDLPLKAAGRALDPARLYQSSAKMHSRFDEPRMVEAALREGILPTNEGISKAQGIVEEVGKQIDASIDAAAGESVPISSVLKNIDELKINNTYMDTDFKSNLAEIEKVVEDYKDMLADQGKTELTPTDAQTLKQNLYRKINWNREYSTGTPMDEATRKVMAKSLKEELENIIPEIKGLNLRQGDMIELQDALGVPASRIGRRDIIGIGTPIKAIAGSGAAGLPGMAAGAVVGTFDSPHVKARLALRINEIKKMNITNAEKRVMALEVLRNAGAMQNEGLME